MAKRRVAKESKETNELEILHPDRPVKVAGRDLIVREYGFIEGQRLLYLAEPIIKEMANMFTGGVPDFTDIQFIAAKHVDNIAKLVAVCIDQPEEFVTGLSLSDGDILMSAWWQVNGNFYIRSAAQIAEAQKMMKS